MRLAGKVALITGAAAGVEGELMGFGGAAARLFAREGAKVVLTDIKEEMGFKTAAQIRAQGGEALFLRHDVTSEADWQEVIQTTLVTFGALHVLVNNAGTGARYTVEETTAEVWDAQMAVHAKSTFLGTKYAIPLMRQAGGGSIINVSSIYGLVGSPTSAAYHAAKGAIRIFTKAAAIQYAQDHIRVNSIHPGYCLTPLTSGGYGSDPQRQAWSIARTPLGRLGTADDIAYGMLYLASDSQPYVCAPYAFVFNGFLKGVRFPRRVPGAIGAEKIWSLVQEQLVQGIPPQQALATVYAVLTRHSRDIQACNMGLSDGQRYVLYNGNPHGRAYYQLHQAQQGALHMVCSEPFGAWAWRAYESR